MGNELTCLLGQDWIRADEFVVHALLDSDLGTSEVLESSDREWKSSVLLHDGGEEVSSTLTLQTVLLIQLSAVNSGPGLGLSTHAISSGDVDIEMDDISWGELPVVNSLLWGLLIDNALVTIDQVLFGLVGDNTLHWLNLVVSADGSDLGGHILVQTSNLDRPGGSEEGVISSQNNIGLLSVGLSSDNDGVSAVGSVAVNVGSKLNLDDVFGLKFGGVISAWGEVSADLVDRDASWECNTSLELLRFLIAEGLLQLLHNEIVNSSANGRDVGAINAKGDCLLEGSFR